MLLPLWRLLDHYIIHDTKHFKMSWVKQSAGATRIWENVWGANFCTPLKQSSRNCCAPLRIASPCWVPVMNISGTMNELVLLDTDYTSFAVLWSCAATDVDLHFGERNNPLWLPWRDNRPAHTCYNNNNSVRQRTRWFGRGTECQKPPLWPGDYAPLTTTTSRAIISPTQGIATALISIATPSRVSSIYTLRVILI